MRKLLVGLIAIIGCLSAGVAQARTIVSPLSVHTEKHRYFAADPKEKLTLDMWGTGYCRFATKAYDENKKTKTVSLSELLFGKSNFRHAESFPDATSSVLSNPFVGMAVVNPTLEYIEKGAVVGATLQKRSPSKKLRFGARARLPFKSVTMTEQANVMNNASISESLNDVRRLVGAESCDNNAGTDQRIVTPSYAYRMDFLSQLPAAYGGTTMMMTFGDAVNKVLIAGQNICGAAITNLPVAVRYSSDGSVPAAGSMAVSNALTGAAALPATGAGASAAGMYFNDTNTYYGSTNLAGLTDNQRKLFVVPVFIDGSGILNNNAMLISNAIENMVSQSSQSIKDYWDAQGISFADRTKTGLGNLDTELFIGYEFLGDVFGEVNLGIVWPTDRKVDPTKDMLYQPTGNNGHFELRGGGDMYWDCFEWLRLSMDSAYSFVLPRKEDVALPFKGATVKNIGPGTKAPVSWQYFKGAVNLIFFHPDDAGIRMKTGYELYYKTKDKVSLAEGTGIKKVGNVYQGKDFEGNWAELDKEVIRNKTNQVAHKLTNEFSVQLREKCEGFGGFSYVFAGKNAPRELVWHLGVGVNL